MKKKLKSDLDILLRNFYSGLKAKGKPSIFYDKFLRSWSEKKISLN